jgi:hypothetical protein
LGIIIFIWGISVESYEIVQIAYFRLPTRMTAFLNENLGSDIQREASDLCAQQKSKVAIKL